MKLVTFAGPDGREALGVLTAGGRQVVDVAAASERAAGTTDEAYASMLALVRAGSGALTRLRELASIGAPTLPLEQVRLLAPLPLPEQIRCFASFEKHGVQSSEAMLKVMASRAPDPVRAEEELRASGRFRIPKMWYERPLYYKGNRFSVVGPGAAIAWPAYSNVIDYELELGCVIAAAGKDIRREDAGRFIFGYFVCNDLSARDEQSIEMQAPLGPAKGKDFDGGLAMGPCIVTADEFDLSRATMLARVNGAEWSRGTAADMHHRFEDMIAYVSRSETLHPGEVFLSGCVGSGCGMEQGRYLSRGDLVELEIEGIGVLANRIV